MINKSNVKIEHYFLILSLIFGSIFAVSNPPFMSPDENFHFIKAFDVSQGHLIRESPINITIPKSFDSIYHLQWWIYAKKTHPYINSLDVNKNWNINYLPTYDYPFLPYLGTAFVIKVGELFNASPLVLMCFGRLINLCVYILIVYFGIKLVPIGRYMFLLLALMPMSLYLAASISADSLNLALSFFIICLFLNLAFKEDKINKKDILLVSICILGLTLSKRLYALLGLLFFIIPRYKFNSFKDRLVYFVFTFLPFSTLLVLYNTIFEIKDIVTSSSHTTNWWDFFVILLNTLQSHNFLKSFLIGFVGWFGWGTNPLPLFNVYFYLIALLIASFLSFREDFELDLKQKFVYLMTCFVCFMSIFKVALNWSVDGNGLIFGVQGRYFIPLAPLFFLVLYNKRINRVFKKKKDCGILFEKYLKVFVMGTTILSLCVSLYVIIFATCYKI
jgi:uncharacterized membrane protein